MSSGTGDPRSIPGLTATKKQFHRSPSVGALRLRKSFQGLFEVTLPHTIIGSLYKESSDHNFVNRFRFYIAPRAPNRTSWVEDYPLGGSGFRVEGGP